MPCFPGAFNRAFNSPGSMELLKHRRWNRIFRSFRKSEKGEKRNTSEGIPFFSKNFRWKSAFHLIYHRNNRFFHTKGKRPFSTTDLQKKKRLDRASCCSRSHKIEANGAILLEPLSRLSLLYVVGKIMYLLKYLAEQLVVRGWHPNNFLLNANIFDRVSRWSQQDDCR